MITHIMPNAARRPIAFDLRKLTGIEKNYAQIKCEVLGTILGVKKFY